MIDFGKNGIIGQEKVRSEISRILQSERISHAYLLAGPPGVGKKALALAFAEAVNGIQNLSELGPSRTSSKSSWFVHPDIHVFIPLPKIIAFEEQKSRLELLANDPYAIVDFGNRPALSGDSDGKNRNAFYSIDYFRDEIRPATTFRPNEGRRTVVILSNIEKMQAKAANAFLKTLEEPGQDLMFILTTDSFHALLPTIVSRCQILRCTGLTESQVHGALVTKDGLNDEDARYLARLSGGNYALTRFYDPINLRQTRKDIVQYLRVSYTQDPVDIIRLANTWQGSLNTEGQIGVLNLLETFLRDIQVYMHTGQTDMLTNIDQEDVIRKFTASLQQARIEDMIAEINACRPLLYQNVAARMVFTVLANRFTYLMRGLDKPIPDDQPWHHLPAIA